MEESPSSMSNEANKIEDHPTNKLQLIANENGLSIDSVEFARYMDKIDPLHYLRHEFHYPKMRELYGVDLGLVDPDEDCVYFCGNSLGLCPKKAKYYIDIEMDKWAKVGVQGYMQGDLPWIECDEKLDTDMAKLVGGKPDEVGIMNGLTVNLHLLLYAFTSQIQLHGFNPKTAMLCIEPREGESVIRTEDIVAKIEEEGESIAVVCFSGVHYYTGQLFDIPAITKAGHKKGCYVGFDLAHATGNVELHLHDWDVDFACWCSYKYLNSSAGGLGCIFLHEKHKNNNFPKLQGWWGHQITTRFQMDNDHDPIPGAYNYRISNTPGLLCAPLKASLEIFNKTSMKEITAKSRLLTAYLEMRIKKKFQKDPKYTPDGSKEDWKHICVDIITPSDINRRGSQLSLSFSINISHVFKELEKRGVVCDERKPSVIRVSPAPLYCSFEDVHRFMLYLQDALVAAADYKTENI